MSRNAVIKELIYKNLSQELSGVLTEAVYINCTQL